MHSLGTAGATSPPRGPPPAKAVQGQSPRHAAIGPQPEAERFCGHGIAVGGGRDTKPAGPSIRGRPLPVQRPPAPGAGQPGMGMVGAGGLPSASSGNRWPQPVPLTTRSTERAIEAKVVLKPLPLSRHSRFRRGRISACARLAGHGDQPDWPSTPIAVPSPVAGTAAPPRVH